jgi:hypothetical protein
MRAAPAIALACAACAACATGSAGTPPAGAAPAPTRAVTYGPGVTRYRSASHQHLDRRVGSQSQSNDAALVAYLSATLTPDSAGLRVTFTVDSVPEYVTGAPGTTGADAARGATFSGTLAPDGTIAALAGGDSTVRLLAQLGEQLQHFYPRTPGGGISPGMRWTDTTRTTSTGSGVPLTMTAVSEHVVTAFVDTLGTRALPIETRTTYTFAGTGSQGGEPFSVEGTGQRHTVELMGLAGRFLGLAAADTSAYTIALKAADLSIPARQTRADTVSVLR